MRSAGSNQREGHPKMCGLTVPWDKVVKIKDGTIIFTFS